MKLLDLCFFSLLILVFSSGSFAQINEDFSDGDLGANPLWQGDVSDFLTNASSQLQLNAAAVADTSVLVTAVSLDTDAQITWEFWLQLNFDPSNNNNARYYLLSDQLNLKGSLNGYYLRVGENGDLDALKLYRQDGSSSTLILTGSVNTYPTSPVMRVRVVREGNGIWNLSSDASGGMSFVAEGSIQDDTHTNMQFSGLFFKYTSTNSTNFLFDDLIINGDIIVDTTPPSPVSAVALNSLQVDVAFSEALDPVSAGIEANYAIAGLGNPITTTPDGIDPALVHLEFGSDFPANITQTLNINGVEDLNGNVLNGGSIQFTWVEASNPMARSVVINEIFADPSPSFGLPEVEYVELHNPGEDFFDLEDWQFVNSTTAKVLPAYILQPGSFVLLCDAGNADQLSEFGPVIGISSFTALTNGGDSLTLLGPDESIIDIVVYSDDWYQDPEKVDGGWSLEQINPLLSCSGASNWIASNYPLGGTPGEENSVLSLDPDTQAPQLIQLIANADELVFRFDEPLDPAVSSTAALLIDGNANAGSFQLSTDFSTLTITLQTPLEIGISYTYELGGVQDCEGNEGTYTGDIALGYMAEAGDILINEIMADPSPAVGLPEAEYIEFYNASDKLIDLSTAEFSGATFPSGSLIAPGEHRVALSIDAQAEFPFYADAWGMESWSSTFLTNSGRALVLKNENGEVVDSLFYSLEWYRDGSKDDGGWSLERINPEDPCSDASNWRASTDALGGTPGSLNSVLDLSPDTQSPSVELVLVPGSSSIQVLFDEPVDAMSIEGAVVTLSDGLEVDELIVLGDPATGMEVVLVSPMLPGAVFSISISGISDCWGNAAGTLNGSFALPEFAEPGDLIVNEILSNPYDGGVDFIEIYNRSTKNISLQGWKLGNEDAGQAADIEMITELGYMIFPGEFMVLCTNADAVSAFYPGTRTNRILVMESLPTYNNDEGVVYLLDPLEQVSDRVPYDVDMHYPLLDDTDGVSLERLDYQRDSDDRGNWHSAAETVGFATPGYENSQALNGISQDGELVVEPEVFSPDNDGYQDVCLIQYTLPAEGYTGNLWVYDDSGRKFRTLASNDLLGLSGTYTWDGFGDERQKGRIGIYVIVMEAFTPEGDIEVLKIPCVLAHPLD